MEKRADPEREERRRSPARAEHEEGKDAAADPAAATVARRADGEGEAAGRREAARRSAMAPRALCVLEIWREAPRGWEGAWLVRGLPEVAGPRASGDGRVCGAARLESNLARPMAGRRVG